MWKRAPVVYAGTKSGGCSPEASRVKELWENGARRCTAYRRGLKPSQFITSRLRKGIFGDSHVLQSSCSRKYLDHRLGVFAADFRGHGCYRLGSDRGGCWHSTAASA